MSTPKQQNSFPLRMPEELRARLEQRAKATGRSTNAEIMIMLAAALDAESDLASVPIEVLLKEVTSRLGAQLQIVVPNSVTIEAGIKPTRKRTRP